MNTERLVEQPVFLCSEERGSKFLVVKNLFSGILTRMEIGDEAENMALWDAWPLRGTGMPESALDFPLWEKYWSQSRVILAGYVQFQWEH